MNKWKSKLAAHLNSAPPKAETETKPASKDAANRPTATTGQEQTPTVSPDHPSPDDVEPASSDADSNSLYQDDLHPARIWPD